MPLLHLFMFSIIFSASLFSESASHLTRDDAKEIIIDKETGLVWQDCAANKKLRKNFVAAVAYCESLKHAGFDDWRLPLMDDYDTIIVSDQRNPIVYDNFKFWISNYYWLFEEAESPAFAHRISLFDGNDNDYSKSYKAYVRCVRGGSSAE